MRILHISPTYFGDGSFVGGGERYAYELAKATAEAHEAVLLSFAKEPGSRLEGRLRVEYLRRSRFLKNQPLAGNPFTGRFVRWIRWADVVHCHQVHTLATDVAVVLVKLCRKKVFVTDLGGGHKYSPSAYLPILRRVDGFLLLSEYSRALWRAATPKDRPEALEVIYGGVETEKFAPGTGEKSDSALFVGRLLPHKGVDYLIEAIQGDLALSVVGRAYDEAYLALLRKKSQGKTVTFETSLDDEGLVQKYQGALVTVVPSVYENCYGKRTVVPELLGLVALESMACGTPVIVTNVASLPEIVEDGVTGFVVPPNAPNAIREKLEYLRRNRGVAAEMGQQGRARVMENFTWSAVADRCVEAYRRVQ